MKKKIVKVYCERCEQYLIGAPEGSQVYCPDCGKWQEVEADGKPDRDTTA